MKRWQAILSSIAVAIAGGMVAQIPNPIVKGGAAAGLLSLAGIFADRTSRSNPNGTPATEPYTTPTKKKAKAAKAK